MCIKINSPTTALFLGSEQKPPRGAGRRSQQRAASRGGGVVHVLFHTHNDGEAQAVVKLGLTAKLKKPHRVSIRIRLDHRASCVESAVVIYQQFETAPLSESLCGHFAELMYYFFATAFAVFSV